MMHGQVPHDPRRRPARHGRRLPLARVPLSVLLVALTLLAAGCSRAYYGVWERLGKDKRDLLVDRVEDARDSQEAAREEFRSALEVFREVVEVDGGELEELYGRMEASYEDSRERAEVVRARVDRVEEVSEDLFEEWEEELDEYEDADLRARSARQLRAARTEFRGLMVAMREAEASMVPVLETFQDQVLFLKHNLNARAIAALERSAASVEADVNELIEDMERAIREANRFIEGMRA